MHRMTVAEALSFLLGQDRRHRQGWEQTRLLGGLVYKVLTGESWQYKFPWDDENQSAEPDETTQDEFRTLRAHARTMEKFFNAKGNL